MTVIEYLSMLILLFLFAVMILHMLNGTFMDWIKGKFTVA